LDQAAADIERTVVAMGRSELPAAEVGDLVLAELKKLDLVGYLRFASVYQEVQSADEFLQLLQPWIHRDKESE
tara:strand:- start:274 stop:492 length:219 start_codon:yes stop_codon:yes gene_type:complete